MKFSTEEKPRIPVQQDQSRSHRSLPLVLTGLVLVSLLAAVGCIERPGPRFQWNPPEFRVKGTYYFQPRAAVNNFWSSFDVEQCKIDFAHLREEGFNTIILFLPWGVFQPTVNPITYNEHAFTDLDGILRLADSYGLKVVLRVGTHDHIPRDAGGAKWLAATVLVNEREWAAYGDLFREVAARTNRNANVLFLFWTFEDTGYTPDLWFHQYPENAAAFRGWLHRRPLWWWNLLWREKNSSYETVEPPDQNRNPLNAMKLRAFLDFSDELTARRLPDPCTAAKQGNPNAVVSFQPRAEINWGHDYALQFELPPCYSFVTTWFSPYQSYLFGDKSKELDGKRTASFVPLHLKRTENLARGLPVFVDQFNFQHFGGHAEEGALKTEHEQREFIASALPVLLRDSLGYALWNYHDYYLNVVENGFFRAGLEGWETPAEPGLVRIKPRVASGGPAVEIQPPGFLRQKITSILPNKEYTLSFQARGVKPGARLQVLMRFDSTDQPVATSFTVSSQMKPFRLKLNTPGDVSAVTVTFLLGKGQPAVELQEVMLYPWVDAGGIYDVAGQPRIPLRDLFRKLNALAP